MASYPRTIFLNKTTPPHMLTLVFLAGVATLPMNAFLPSLPSMAAYFEVEYAAIQLTVTVYLAVSAFVQVIIGPLSDHFGRRRVMLWSMMIFCLSCVGAAFAPNFAIFMVFRVIQTTAVAGIVLARAAIRDQVDTAQAASIIGYVTMGMAIVPMFAPAIGGYLDTIFGWQATFWMFLIVGLIGLGITYVDMGETKAVASLPFREQVATYPELLTSPRFWAYCFSAAFGAGAYFSYLGGSAFVGDVIFGLDPFTFGIYFSFPAIGYLAGNFLSGRYSERVGINAMIAAGAIVTCAGMALCLVLFLTTDPVPLSFFGPVICVGLGNGLVLPNATSGMLSVRPHLAGSASGLGGMVMTAGGAMMAAGIGAILSPETGAIPLIVLMLVSSAMPLLLIAYIKQREAHLAQSI